ncbi:polysaccharide lyase 6 family protein [Olleya sp. YSTF-M6]|uniref:Polysaccharide lyase 6 family protein n=1 Tax=Olleya sediminilitoris TaxID=2795739 RepID=A0ABS1WNZ7_9FLAO|nr:polysaccharide lyase 6 family protein [Olleya sediminilitoris]MBL7560856.1 polysaccharide lyase 6 family protein [Olleya sediminilitoris]
MILKNVVSIIFSFLLVSVAFAQDFTVSNIKEFDQAIGQVKPGSTIILKNGIWKDVNLKAYGQATKDAPIIIKAETPGKVVLTGDSSLSIYGEYVIVSGLWFKDGVTTSKYVIQFKKDSKTFANNCRFTNSTISNYKVKDEDNKNHWVDLWGKNNRVDHNNFTGKTSSGTTLVVWLKGDAHIENNHIIDYNFFGHRPDLGENGGETIRIGTSANSMKSSKTIVENNTFKNCDGEIEIISNKSGDNIYRNNLFLESKGTLTLRHGNNALVENNVFLGNTVANTGGIRIINEGHVVRNNLLVGLTGDGYRGPIVMMNGVKNSPLNRYHQVKNVEVVNNTIINCGPITFGSGKDKEKTLAPINTTFANNIISNTTGASVFEAKDDISGITFSNNIVDSQATVDPLLFTKASIDWKMFKALPMPSINNPVLKQVLPTKNASDNDITGSVWAVYVAGAFNLENKKYPKALTVRTGPGWKPVIETPKVKSISVDIGVDPGVGTLRKVISKAGNGDVISLKPGIYYLDKQIKIKSNLKINGSPDGKTIIMASSKLEKPLSYLLRVSAGITVSITNITFDGSNKTPVKYAIVSPDKMESDLYNLTIDTCVFKNFKNDSGGAIIKGYSGTRAELMLIKNSRFEDSFRGINLSYEKNQGQFNANNLIIENTIFNNIEEFAINYKRSIIDSNIEGGNLMIDHCVFNKVSNKEKGSIIKVKGIHQVTIQNTVFDNSFLIKIPVALEGSSNNIYNCLFHDSGFVKVSKGASESNIIYKSPKWEDKKKFIPGKKSPLLKSNNQIETIGLIN